MAGKGFGPHKKRTLCSVTVLLAIFIPLLIGLMVFLWWTVYTNSNIVQDDGETHLSFEAQAGHGKKKGKHQGDVDSQMGNRAQDEENQIGEEVQRILSKRKDKRKASFKKGNDAWEAMKKQKGNRKNKVLKKVDIIPETADSDAKCRGGIVFLTYALHKDMDDNFCRFLESALYNDIPVHVLGWSSKKEDPESKLKEILNEIKKLPETCLVVYTDSHNAVYQEQPLMIRHKLASLQKGLLFSAQCDCEILGTSDYEGCLQDYPESPTQYRYLSTDQWAGNVSALQPMLSEARKKMKSDPSLGFQQVISEYYNNQRFPISLDHESALFQSTKIPSLPELPKCNPMEDLHMKHGYWFNGERSPSVFSFVAKSSIESKILKDFWFRTNAKATKDELRDILFESSTRTFEDVCVFYNPEY